MSSNVPFMSRLCMVMFKVDYFKSIGLLCS
nr:MAG TPA: hypothetical protein [Caudoviricetes sp.]